MKRIAATTSLALGAATAATAAVGVNRRRKRLGTVAPDLRSPMLFVPLSFGNTTLKVVRRLPQPSVPLRNGVELREEVVPADGDRPDLRVLVYDTPDRDHPSGALLWIHGGGLVMGTPEQGNDLCSRFVDELGILVVSVDYRLAPDHPFPAALDDCDAALTWLHAMVDELGVDPRRIAVGGDSAGGGLAACLAQLAHDKGGVDVAFQLLEYPMLDDRTVLRSGDDTFIWSRTSNRFGWSSYLGHPVAEEEVRPYAVAARRTDLAGLPPAWIGVGDIDLFHDEDVEYADRLRAAGVPCELVVVPGMYHAADVFARSAESMQAFVQGMVDALGDAIAEPASAS